MIQGRKGTSNALTPCGMSPHILPETSCPTCPKCTLGDGRGGGEGHLGRENTFPRKLSTVIFSYRTFWKEVPFLPFLPWSRYSPDEMGSRVSPLVPSILGEGIASPSLPMRPLSGERTIARVPRVTPDQYALTGGAA